MGQPRQPVERGRVATENIAAVLAQSIGSEIERVDLRLRNVALSTSRPTSRTARPDGARRGRCWPSSLRCCRSWKHPHRRRGRRAALRPRRRRGRRASEVGDREYFVRTRDGGSPGPVVISGPIRSRLGEHWVVVVARPLRDARGAFAGAIFANVDVARFRAAARGRRPRPSRRSQRARRRSGLVARRSAGDALSTPLGSRTVSAELRDELAEHADAGSFVARTRAGRRRAHQRYRRVGATPSS